MLIKPTERLDMFYHSQGEIRADIVALCPKHTYTSTKTLIYSRPVD